MDCWSGLIHNQFYYWKGRKIALLWIDLRLHQCFYGNLFLLKVLIKLLHVSLGCDFVLCGIFWPKSNQKPQEKVQGLIKFQTKHKTRWHCWHRSSSRKSSSGIELRWMIIEDNVLLCNYLLWLLWIKIKKVKENFKQR